MNIEATVKTIAKQARAAAHKLSALTTEQKNTALEAIAKGIEAREADILAENLRDLDAGEQNGLSKALLDRLRFTPERIAGMAEGVRQVASLPDPVGIELEQFERPNGLNIKKVSTPIGVIGIIYESRPNVTVDCAVLCLKSGNAAILRGGKEAFHSNTILAQIIADALTRAGLPEHAVQLIPTTDRAAMGVMLKQDQDIHAIIPRGGEGLIRFVAENSMIPVIKHYDGICHIYLDKAADPALAESITVNAKCQRPGVCNAAENLLVHKDIASTVLPELAKALLAQGVELRGCELTRALVPEAKEATEEDYRTEYLDLILAVKIVDSLEDAIAFINEYGSMHSDCIVTTDETAAQTFLQQVDSATVYWNASTRFTDGFEFGFGAEIGISTDRLHARGPVGLRELCTYKYNIYGTGQIK